MYRNLFKKIKKEQLSPKEKADGFLKLREFIKENPIRFTPEMTVAEKKGAPIKSPFFNGFFFGQRTFVLAGACMLLLVAGGTAIGSNSSLPGEILYPVKILNEKMESFLSVGTRAQTEVEIQHTLKRLDEAENLSNQNRLDEKKQIEITDNVSLGLQEISKKVTKLQDDGKTKDVEEINTRFKKSLEVRRGIILKLEEGWNEKQKSASSTKEDGENSSNKDSSKNREQIRESGGVLNVKTENPLEL
ncbi:MAG TPA: DUF5667 domain-containing protein [Candidatus Paceibacterota bacterium]